MKKLLFGLLLLVSSTALGQYAWSPIQNSWTRLDGGPPLAVATDCTTNLGSFATCAVVNGVATITFQNFAANMFLRGSATIGGASALPFPGVIVPDDLGPTQTLGYVLTRITDTNTMDWQPAAGGGAPTGAQYWTGAADGTLSAEKNLGALGTGIVINTAGVPSILSTQTCTNQFVRSYNASGTATCASIADADLPTTLKTSYLTLMPENAQFLATNFPQFESNLGTNFPVSGLAFDAAGTEAAYWKFNPTRYASGNVTVKIFWYADTASSGDVVFEASLAAITPDADTQDVETKAFGTVNTVTDTHLGTTGQRVHQTSITVSNLDSLAADDLVWIKVSRNGASGSDTMTGDAIILSVTVSYLSSY